MRIGRGFRNVLVGLAGAAASAAPASAQPECFDYGSALGWRGGIVLSGEPRDILVSGDLAYVAAYDLDQGASLQAVDLADPAHLGVVGQIPLPGVPWRIARLGSDYLLVTCFDAGIQVVRTNPTLQPVIRIDTPGEASGIALIGTLALVSDGAAGVRVYSFDNVAAPRFVGSTPLPDRAYGVAVIGDQALVAGGNAGLFVLDVFRNRNPVLRRTINTPGYLDDVAVESSLAVLADASGSVQIYDLTSIDAPRPVSSLLTRDRARRVTVTDGFAFVADATGGLMVVDIRVPETPLVVASIQTSGEVFTGVRDAHRLLVADSDIGLQLYGAVLPIHPEPRFAIARSGDVRALTIRGEFALLAEGFSGLSVFDLNDPDAPALAGTVALPGEARDVAAGRHSALVADEVGLRIVDIDNPGNPRLLAGLDFSDVAEAVAISEPYAYVATGWDGVQIVDYSDRLSPVATGTLAIIGYAIDVLVDFETLYVLDRYFGLYTYDITDPGGPVFVNRTDFPGRLIRMAITGGEMGIVYRNLEGWPEGGVHLIDVSDPSFPFLVWSVETPGTPGDVAFGSHFMFVADGRAGFHVIDVAGSTAPRLFGGSGTLGRTFGIATYGGRVLIADGAGGFQGYPPTCEPTTPVILAGFSAVPAPGGVRVSWEIGGEVPGTAFGLHRGRIAGDDELLAVMPIRPRGPYTYLDTRVEGGVRYGYRLEVREPGSTRWFGPVWVTAPDGAGALLTAGTPNPFSSTTRISFVLPDGGSPSLRIYDVAGRLVRRLLEGVPVPPGGLNVTWDGRDDLGREVAPGVYTIDLTAPGLTIHRRLIRSQ